MSIQQKIRRRKFLQFGLLAGLSTLSACSLGQSSSLLVAPKGILPKELLKGLPSSWRFKPLQSTNQEIPFFYNSLRNSDLIALDDGWIDRLPPSLLQPIDIDTKDLPFDSKTKSFQLSLGDKLSNLFLPIGVSPWVMLFRKGSYWLPEAKESWNVLLEPSLKGKVLLPQSPRLIISLAEKMGHPSSLKSLFEQVKIFDDQNALNWLISGEVRVVVIPLSRCLSVLKSDQRLSLALPKTGSPLNWTVLARPLESKQPLPISWIRKTWEAPILRGLLSQGWRPPLPYENFKNEIDYIPNRYKEIVFPSKENWEKCWSLPPLSVLEDIRLKGIWDNSINI